MSQLFILNRAGLGELSTGVTGTIFSALTALMSTRFVNSLGNALSNISYVRSLARLADGAAPTTTSPTSCSSRSSPRT